jgi:hypothetical protein
MIEPTKPRWQALAKSDFMCSDKNHGLGCALARSEYDARSTLNRYKNLKAVKEILTAAKLQEHRREPLSEHEGVSLPPVSPVHSISQKDAKTKMRPCHALVHHFVCLRRLTLDLSRSPSLLEDGRPV